VTARDRWTVDLNCEKCGATALARLSQADGLAFKDDKSISIDYVPEGWDYRRASYFDYPIFYHQHCRASTASRS